MTQHGRSWETPKRAVLLAAADHLCRTSWAVLHGQENQNSDHLKDAISKAVAAAYQHQGDRMRSWAVPNTLRRLTTKLLTSARSIVSQKSNSRFIDMEESIESYKQFRVQLESE